MGRSSHLGSQYHLAEQLPGNEHRAATDGTDPFSEYVEKRSQDTSVHNG